MSVRDLLEQALDMLRAAESFTTKAWDVARVRNASVPRDKLLQAIPKAVARWAREQFDNNKREGQKWPDDAPMALFKLPFREIDGTVNVNALRAARAALLGARGGVDLPPDVKRDALAELDKIWAEWLKSQRNASETFSAFDETNRLYFSIAEANPVFDETLTPERLKRIIDDTNKAIETGFLRPPIKLEHKEEGPALAHIDHVALDEADNVVFADASIVDAQALPAGTPDIRQAILGGSYPNRSIEIAQYSVPWADEPVELIRAVALIGAGVPVVKGPAQAYTAIYSELQKLHQEDSMTEKDETRAQKMQTASQGANDIKETPESQVKCQRSESEHETKQGQEHDIKHDDVIRLAEENRKLRDAVMRMRESLIEGDVRRWHENLKAHGRWLKLFDEMSVIDYLKRAKFGVEYRQYDESKTWELIGEGVRLLEKLIEHFGMFSEKGVLPREFIAMPTDETPTRNRIYEQAERFYAELCKNNPATTRAEAYLEFFRQNPELYNIYQEAQ